MKNINKILILGSGALKIGEAGEFDYSGSQAIKAVKEEDIETILINPNIATVQTDSGFADEVYFLPIKPYFVEKVIEKEKPDGILLSFGGQTALNCAVELDEKGILQRYNVEVLGTPIETIKTTEDRKIFREKLKSINVKTPTSKSIKNTEEGIKFASQIGYPVMVRAAYELGGKGSGIVKNKEELKESLSRIFTHTNQALVEESLEGWKEIEYEVVRDQKDNCITVCNMENFDPLGIHTGESIVIAPSQTLNNNEYHKLRKIAVKVIKELGVIGECNIQYALDPKSDDYRVIEVNARLSRSSALASKATGYPLAFVAAKLALGKDLPNLLNTVTKKTTACFEPAMDYVVVKIPRWDLQKFKEVKNKIGSEMKSVGEVMAIGRNFEESLQKALRMLQIGKHGFVGDKNKFDDLEEELKNPTDKRIFAISKALEEGFGVKKINELTKIDPWFLHKCKNIVRCKELLYNGLNKEKLKRAKKLGFSDFQIAQILDLNELDIRNIRKEEGVTPFVKQIDTLAAEWPAKTNYLYLTYHAMEHDIEFNKRKSVIILGSGAYRIGSSVEFDWCCVNSIREAQELGYEVSMINYNPETVSTDYDECGKLYFDELSLERVLDIYELEEPDGIIVSMGGQIPNTISEKLRDNDVNILGTGPEDIDNAENRSKFSSMLDEIGLDQPAWTKVSCIDEAEDFAENVGYPVLVRPSYVLSGSSMAVAFDLEGLDGYLKKASRVTPQYPVIISKFLQGAKEIEIDAVAQDGKLKAGIISEHVENAGVHSGDASIVTPPQKVYVETLKRVKQAASKIAEALNITGPFNIQLLAKDNNIKIIECNLRSARSFPFSSKIHGINLARLGTRAILLKEEIDRVKDKTLDIQHVGVKAPQFSFSRLRGADPLPSVEMTSTGEVGCIGDNMKEAFLKSLISTGIDLPKNSILICISGEKNRYDMLDSVKKLKQIGLQLYATEHTMEFYEEKGINTKLLHKIQEKTDPNVLTYLRNGDIDLVISMPRHHSNPVSESTKIIRRAAIDHNVPLINNPQMAKLFIKSISEIDISDLKIKNWKSYFE